jgi:ribosome-binding factor A
MVLKKNAQLVLLCTLLHYCVVFGFYIVRYELGRAIRMPLALQGTRGNFRPSSISSRPTRLTRRLSDDPFTDLRKLKYGRILRDELSDIICSLDIKSSIYPDEGLLESVSITDIDLTNDLERAKVYFSVLGNTVQRKQIYVWLNNNVGQVRYSLAQRLRNMKRVPALSFVLVDRQAENMLSDAMDEIAPPKIVPYMEEVDFEEME